MDREMITPMQFKEHADLCRLTLDKLQDSFEKELPYLIADDGTLSMAQLNAMLKKVKAKVEIERERFNKDESAVIEGLFDSYVGAVSMTGQHEYAMAQMRAILDFDRVNTFFY